VKPTCFVELMDGRRLRGKALAAAKLRIAAKTSSHTLGTRYSVSLENTGDDAAAVRSVGLDFRRPKRRGRAPDWRVFVDPGCCVWAGVKRLDALEPDPSLGPIEEQRVTDEVDSGAPFHRSDLQTVIWDARNGRGSLVGFLGQRHGPNKVDVVPNRQGNEVERICAWQELGKSIAPGAVQGLDPLVVAEGTDPYRMLEDFGEAVKRHHGREFDEPPIVGMLTWYGYHTAISEEIILRNAKIIAELFGGYPQAMEKIMMLDHGWQQDANWGYWKPDKKYFPHGMKWLAGRLDKLGLKLGLWYTPFCITENAPSRAAPAQMRRLNCDGRAETGTAGVWGYRPGEKGGRWPITFFDGARRDVQQKWSDELSEMKRWGAVYWKLDFFVLGASRAVTAPGTGDLYARTWRNFRRAVGKRAHLAPCSCGTNIQLGYCDSVRIGTDIGVAGQWPDATGAYRYGLSTIAGFG